MAQLVRPRKHYQWYYSTPEADRDMCHAAQGLSDFLRAYYHVKSADWPANSPFRLAGWQADELAKMPTYYIMDKDQTMAETVAPHMPSAAQIAACQWLSDTDLTVYSGAYAATGFQGGLQWYRCATNPQFTKEMRVFSGRTIDVPSLFLAGQADWGVYQKPGDFERMQATACTDMRACHLIPGAGHWVQQEQPAAVIGHLLDFLASL
jgi:pimeloyl-ACP methyl ester carboxylesterase